MQIYKLPFQYPKDFPVTQLRDLLVKYSVKLGYDFDVDFDDPVKHTVTGTLDDLIGFHREIDGPGQSFPVDEFKEWASEYEIDDMNIRLAQVFLEV
jgi:hypothetical protein